MYAGRDLGRRDCHQMQKWGASEGSVSKVLLGVNRNTRKDVGRQTGCPVRVQHGSPPKANLGTASREFRWREDQRRSVAAGGGDPEAPGCPAAEQTVWEAGLRKEPYQLRGTQSRASLALHEMTLSGSTWATVDTGLAARLVVDP